MCYAMHSQAPVLEEEEEEDLPFCGGNSSNLEKRNVYEQGAKLN